jgi:hypothetical protein
LGDKIFFAASCQQALPSTNEAYQTQLLDLFNASSTGSMQVRLSSTLTAQTETTPRNLQACFASQEASLAASGFVSLPDGLIVIPRPRLGDLAANRPGTIRAIPPSTPDYLISPFEAGDLLFFHNESCGLPPDVGSRYSTTLINVSLTTVASTGSFALPSNPKLLTIDASTQSVLKACFASSGIDASDSANWVELEDRLELFPPPIANLQTEWKQGQVLDLSFDSPLDNAAQANDIVVLQQGSCENAELATTATASTTSSAPIVLTSGGVAREFPLAAGRVNNLEQGTYKICFASGSSGADSAADFITLTPELVIQETVDPGAPELSIQQSILLGVDLIATWAAANTLNTRVTSAGAWVGLYRHDDCAEDNEWQHRCYLASRTLPVGVGTGEIRFSQADYRSAGKFELRYFRGDTQHGQGQECKGMAGITSGVYLQCRLVSSVTSNVVNILPTLETRHDISSVPGFEHVISL